MKKNIDFFDIICLIGLLSAMLGRPSKATLMVWIIVALTQHQLNKKRW